MSETTLTLIAALVATVIGVGTFFHLFLMVRSWPRATGTVTGNVTLRTSVSRHRYSYFPLIEFEAANGKTYEVRGDIGLNRAWPVGDNITLRYRAANPRHTTTMKAWQRLVFSGVFIGFGAALWYAWLKIPGV